MKTCTVTAKLLLLTVTAVSIISASAQSEIDLEDARNQIGYSIGVNIGMNLMQQGITADVRLEAFMADLSLGSSKNVA